MRGCSTPNTATGRKKPSSREGQHPRGGRGPAAYEPASEPNSNRCSAIYGIAKRHISMRGGIRLVELTTAPCARCSLDLRRAQEREKSASPRTVWSPRNAESARCWRMKKTARHIQPATPIARFLREVPTEIGRLHEVSGNRLCLRRAGSPLIEPSLVNR